MQEINTAVPVSNVLDQQLGGEASVLSYMNTFCNITDSKKRF